MASTIIYKDIPLSFTPNPITGNIKVVENESAVKQALKNLILTNYYEVPYESYFGANLSAYLFDNFTSFTEHAIRKQIITAVRNYEPRVELLSVKVKAEQEQHNVDVTIKFRTINSTEPTTLSLVLERVR